MRLSARRALGRETFHGNIYPFSLLLLYFYAPSLLMMKQSPCLGLCVRRKGSKFTAVVSSPHSSLLRRDKWREITISSSTLFSSISGACCTQVIACPEGEDSEEVSILRRRRRKKRRRKEIDSLSLSKRPSSHSTKWLRGNERRSQVKVLKRKLCKTNEHWGKPLSSYRNGDQSLSSTYILHIIRSLLWIDRFPRPITRSPLRVIVLWSICSPNTSGPSPLTQPFPPPSFTPFASLRGGFTNHLTAAAEAL